MVGGLSIFVIHFASSDGSTIGILGKRLFVGGGILIEPIFNFDDMALPIAVIAELWLDLVAMAMVGVMAEVVVPAAAFVNTLDDEDDAVDADEDENVDDVVVFVLDE
jgi:hypothetical protein